MAEWLKRPNGFCRFNSCWMDIANGKLPLTLVKQDRSYLLTETAPVGGGSEGKIDCLIYPPALDLWLSHAYRVEIRTKELFTQQNSSY